MAADPVCADTAAALLVERRWFGYVAAAEAAAKECAAFFEALQMAQERYRAARDNLARFERLRDALERQMSGLDADLVAVPESVQ